ncbi:MAG: DUF2189 domain-containing protein [Beijerinckiaceae bacterium]
MSEMSSAGKPVILTLSQDDLTDALAAGFRDFKAALPFSVFFGAFYAMGGALIAALLFATNAQFVVYPLATGFALVAPFAAAGTYEISRRLEAGEELSWPAILKPRHGSQELGWMALVTTFALVIWLDVALFLYLIFFGTRVLSLEELITAVATTPMGVLFFVVGNLAGACIGSVLFSLTAVSCPMLIDRDVDAITAMITSVRAVRANARQMITWAILIGFLLAASTMAFLVGLVFVLPLLGHTAWHLYRKLVAAPNPAGRQMPEIGTPQNLPHAA